MNIKKYMLLFFVLLSGFSLINAQSLSSGIQTSNLGGGIVNQVHSSSDMNENYYVITYYTGVSNSQSGIYLKVYDALTFNPFSSEVNVALGVVASANQVKVRIDNSNNIFVLYTDEVTPNSSTFKKYIKKFDINGNQIGARTEVTNNSNYANFSIAPNGDLLVVYRSNFSIKLNIYANDLTFKGIKSIGTIPSVPQNISQTVVNQIAINNNKFVVSYSYTNHLFIKKYTYSNVFISGVNQSSLQSSFSETGRLSPINNSIAIRSNWEVFYACYTYVSNARLYKINKLSANNTSSLFQDANGMVDIDINDQLLITKNYGDSVNFQLEIGSYDADYKVKMFTSTDNLIYESPLSTKISHGMNSVAIYDCQYILTGVDRYLSNDVPGENFECYHQLFTCEACDGEIDLGPAIVHTCTDEQPLFNITDQISGNPTITWYLNGNVIQNGGTIFEPGGMGNYSVSVVYNASCEKTASVLITNEGCCDLTVDLGPDITICKGDPWPVISVAEQISYGGIYWGLGSVDYTQTADSESFQTNGEGEYFVDVQYGPNNECSATDSIIITVKNCEDCKTKASFNVTYNNCTILFTNTSSTNGGTTITGYLWDFGDGTTSIEENPTHIYATGGTHYVTLSVYGLDANGNCCVDTVSKKVIVHGNCNTKCYLKPGIGHETINSDVTMFYSTSTTNATTTIVGYEWTVDGNVVSNNEFFATVYHGEEVCLTIYGITEKGECCNTTRCGYYGNTHPIKKSNKNQTYKIHPNPAKNEVTLDFNEFNKSSEKLMITIYDFSGRKVFGKETNSLTYHINTASWVSGIYICKVQNGDEISIKKIIKE